MTMASVVLTGIWESAFSVGAGRSGFRRVLHLIWLIR